MKDNKILFGTFIVLLLILTISLSYAYFSTSVGGNDNAKDVVVEVGTLKLTYTDSQEIEMENIEPGETATKKVTVKNNGTLDTVYNLVWQELNNTFINDEMLISATCKRLNSSNTEEGTCENIEESPISGSNIKKNISIESGITHEYSVTITFKETNEPQNYNQGKTFSGILGINEYKPSSFKDDSWETIIANVKSGDISDYKVGDTKEVDLGTTYGTHTLRIANTSTPSECSTEGFSQTACGFVLEFADVITKHNMNDTNTNVGGWPATSMRTFVNNDIYNSLPSDLKNGIIDTTVVSGHGSSDSSNFTSTDKLYLLAPTEIYSDFNNSSDTAKDLTRTLDYYTNIGVTTSSYSGAIKKNGTSVTWWWLRSAISSTTSGFLYVHINGDWINGSAYDSNGVAPAFRLG